MNIFVYLFVYFLLQMYSEFRIIFVMRIYLDISEYIRSYQNLIFVALWRCLLHHLILSFLSRDTPDFNQICLFCGTCFCLVFFCVTWFFRFFLCHLIGIQPPILKLFLIEGSAHICWVVKLAWTSNIW